MRATSWWTRAAKIVEIVKHKVVPAHGQPSDAAGDAAAVPRNPPAAPEAARRSAGTWSVPPKAEPEVVVRRPELELAVQRPVPEMPRAVRTPGPAAAGTPAAPQAARRDADDNPFVELGPDGMPIVPEAPQAAEAAASDDDGEFIEVDLSRPEGRLVLGPSGLVELERPAVRPAAPPPVRPAMPVSDGPFTELTVGGDAGASSPETFAGAAAESLSGSESLPGMPLLPGSPLLPHPEMRLRMGSRARRAPADAELPRVRPVPKASSLRSKPTKPVWSMKRRSRPRATIR